jgi:hypothetical protein
MELLSSLNSLEQGVTPVRDKSVPTLRRRYVCTKDLGGLGYCLEDSSINPDTYRVLSLNSTDSVCRQLCRGDITLKDAQAVFLARDWRKEYEKFFNGLEARDQ